VSSDINLEVQSLAIEDYTISSTSDIVADTNQRLRVEMTVDLFLKSQEYIAIKFPYLYGQISMVENPQIIRISRNLPSVTTEWDENSQTLFIKMQAGLNKGDIEFLVSSIQNPYSTKLSGFEIATMTSDKLGLIQSTKGEDVYLKVYTPLTIDKSLLSLTLSDTKVQTYSEYEIRVQVPIPVTKKCIFEFIFDRNSYIFDEGYKTQKASGAWGSQNLVITRKETMDNTEIKTRGGCNFDTIAN
jgi:hypothetical protein